MACCIIRHILIYIHTHTLTCTPIQENFGGMQFYIAAQLIYISFTPPSLSSALMAR